MCILLLEHIYFRRQVQDTRWPLSDMAFVPCSLSAVLELPLCLSGREVHAFGCSGFADMMTWACSGLQMGSILLERAWAEYIRGCRPVLAVPSMYFRNSPPQMHTEAQPSCVMGVGCGGLCGFWVV